MTYDTLQMLYQLKQRLKQIGNTGRVSSIYLRTRRLKKLEHHIKLYYK